MHQSFRVDDDVFISRCSYEEGEKICQLAFNYGIKPFDFDLYIPRTRPTEADFRMLSTSKGIMISVQQDKGAERLVLNPFQLAHEIFDGDHASIPAGGAQMSRLAGLRLP